MVGEGRPTNREDMAYRVYFSCLRLEKELWVVL